MDRNLQLRCSPNSWGKMGSSSPANHRTTCIKWPWPSKCWMGEQVSLLWNTSLPISFFWIVARRTLLQDNPQLNISWDGKSETVSHYWSRIWTVEEKQVKQKEYHDEWCVKFREFKLNELVLVLNWRGGVGKWISGRISQVKGPRTYLVCCGNQIRFVHVDHLKGTGCNPSCNMFQASYLGAWALTRSL